MRITGNPASGGKKPGTPTIGTATGGNASATVAYTAPTYVGKGGAVTYRALSTPGSLTGTGASPITVSGLTNGTAYTFQVRAETSYGVLGDYSSASNSTTPAVPTSYDSIASATGTGSSGTITFSSIPGTYQSLQLRVNMIGTVASNVILVRFNGDTGSNYARHYLASNGSVVTAGGQITQTSISAGPNNGFDTTYPATYLIDIHNYSNSSQNKTARIFAGMDKNAVGGSVSLHSGLWLNTNAITSISLICSSGNFTTTSTASLYGIKGA